MAYTDKGLEGIGYLLIILSIVLVVILVVLPMAKSAATEITRGKVKILNNPITSTDIECHKTEQKLMQCQDSLKNCHFYLNLQTQRFRNMPEYRSNHDID